MQINKKEPKISQSRQVQIDILFLPKMQGTSFQGGSITTSL